MTEKYERLIKLLKELFQIDRPDLDFGIYRIMNQKREEITSFLDKDLLPQVKKAFAEYGAGGRGDIQTELDAAIAKAHELGADPETLPKVKKLREKLGAAVDVDELENEIYSHLFTFFRRYYKDGDFLSLRRYKKDVYAIPYEGEEVKLHWANADQYYIKSSEDFRDYSFKLGDVPATGEEDTRRRVHFKLVDADTEIANNKAQEGKERRFVLCENSPMVEIDGELCIRFEYKPTDEKQAQKKLNEDAVAKILNDPEFVTWIPDLARETNGKSVLAKHLTTYTTKNTSDYFIHKDLGGFLRRELDFYIKNEIIYLDDFTPESMSLDAETLAIYERASKEMLAKIAVLRRIAHKIICFLEQLENFQKKLWLKKKFVVQTDYCITLDRVPEELYPEICANEAQRKEWVELFAIDEIEKGLMKAGYSNPLTEMFLKQNPFLVLDTKYFTKNFTRKLLSAIDCIDNHCDGLLINSENYQGLRLMCEKFKNKINCTYIDPPYNTGGDGFLYKDTYRHSSWASMLSDRLMVTSKLLNDCSVFFCSIDDTEQEYAKQIFSSIFSKENFIANIIWQKKYAPQNDSKWISENHDYIMVFSKDKSSWSPQKLIRTAENNKGFKNPDEDIRGLWKADNYKCNKTAEERPNLYYPIINPYTEKKIWPNKNAVWRYSQKQHEKNVKNNQVWWGIDGKNSVPAYKRFLSNVGGIVPQTIWTYKEVGHNQDAIRQLRDILPKTSFASPKPAPLISKIIHIAGEGPVLDFFAGSGTTAQAVIELNRKSGTSHKYILIEMGEHFSSVLKPRIQKVIYSDSWKNGKPISRTGSSHMFKYMSLESYEDALNNLEFKRTESQGKLLMQSPNIKEEYMLSYMMDLETDGSASLLNVDRFDDPWNYTMKIATGSAGETKVRPVDLIETFNYLLGLTIIHRDFIRDIEIIEGTNPEGEKVLVIWRNIAKTNNEQLDDFFRKQNYSSRDTEFDLIYVNGDNNLENLKRTDETWKVRLIEENFKRLMFDVEDV